MNQYNCTKCRDTGVHKFKDIHADSIETVYIPCPFCDKGKQIDESRIPESEFEYDNIWESREERDRYERIDQ